MAFSGRKKANHKGWLFFDSQSDYFAGEAAGADAAGAEAAAEAAGAEAAAEAAGAEAAAEPAGAEAAAEPEAAGAEPLGASPILHADRARAIRPAINKDFFIL